MAYEEMLRDQAHQLFHQATIMLKRADELEEIRECRNRLYTALHDILHQAGCVAPETMAKARSVLADSMVKGARKVEL